MRATITIRMRPRLMRAAMMPVTVGRRLVALLLAIRRLLALTALQAVRILALPMRALLTVPATLLPMPAPLMVLTPVLPRAARARAPKLVIPRR